MTGSERDGDWEGGDPVSESTWERIVHKTRPVLVIADVDEGIAKMVEYLQTIPDVRTHASCQGTIGEGGPHPYRPQVMITWNTPDAFARLQREFDMTREEGDQWAYVHPREGKDQSVPGEAKL